MAWIDCLKERLGLDRSPVVAVIRLEGVISPSGGSLRRGLNLAALAPLIETAFKIKRVKAVALAVNSPGGSPVQSSLIFKRIRALASEKDVPVVTFCEDVAASGGYWLALAGDEVFADPASIIGSIGVITASFGFPGLLEKMGVERRVHTAGKRKGMLDPFQPEKKEDVASLLALQKDMHETFTDLVRERRNGKLKGKEADLFSGEFWTGRKALDLGLIDGLGDLRSVMRERYGEEVKFKLVKAHEGWLKRHLGRTKIAEEALGALEERAWWGRVGL